MSDTPSRKEEHVKICVEEKVSFRSKTNGFEEWEFEHNALPEIDFEEIDPSIQFLQKRISFPLLITGMTGGYEGALKINSELAEVAQQLSIAMGVGSQKQALENEQFHESYSIVRKLAPGIPIISNIGATELVAMKNSHSIRKIIDLIEADALAIHLNPLQEFLQPEGTPKFRGVLRRIELFVKELPVPIIVKEVGAGISAHVARKLFDIGVRWIDVSGAGGTSWAGVEIKRRGTSLPVSSSFWDWGIRTTDALIQVSKIKPQGASLIASGGIIDGIMIAKSIALGASLAGSARILLQTLREHGQKGLMYMLEGWKNDLCGAMFLVGATSISELQRATIHHIHHN